MLLAVSLPLALVFVVLGVCFIVMDQLRNRDK